MPIWTFGAQGADFTLPANYPSYLTGRHDVNIDFTDIMMGQVQFEFIPNNVSIVNGIEIEIVIQNSWIGTSDQFPWLSCFISMSPFLTKKKSFSLSSANYYMVIRNNDVTNSVLVRTTINTLGWS